MKRITFSILSLAVLGMAGCASDNAAYDATGTFEATEVTVSAESSGKIESLNVAEGQTVKAGERLGSIDATQLRLKKEQLNTAKRQLEYNRRQLSASKRQMIANREATDSKALDLGTQMASLNQQIANLQRERQRFAELLADGAATRKQVDDIDYQIGVLQRQLTAAQEQLRSTNQSLEAQSRSIGAQMSGVDAQMAGVSAQDANIGVQQAQLDDQLSNTVISSPITGVVLEKYMEQGELATTGKPLFKVADTGRMVLRAYITSGQLRNVRVGQSVKVYADYGNGERKEYRGRIAWISSKSEFTPKTILTDDERADLVYAVKIAVANDGYLKIGMYGEVSGLAGTAPAEK